MASAGLKREGHAVPHRIRAVIRSYVIVALFVSFQNGDGFNDVTPSDLADVILSQHASSKDGYLAQNEYLVWTVDHQLPVYFLDLLFQVSSRRITWF